MIAEKEYPLSNDSSLMVPGEESCLVTYIRASHGWWELNLSELWRYRDLLFFLTWRNIRAMYAQSVIGIGWAVIQPVFQMVVFTIVFGRLAKVDSEGIPYAIFNYAALVPWTYFSGALTGASNSLVGAAGIITKVYFPRLMVPFSAVLSKFLDFCIAFGVLLVLMAWYRIAPSISILFVPGLVILLVLTAAGIGIWLTALGIQYRDVKHALNFFVQLLMYGAPVVYPASLIPEQYQRLYSINPMVGVIEGFRSALLHSRPMPWEAIGIGAISAVIIFISGLFYFRRMERFFADVA